MIGLLSHPNFRRVWLVGALAGTVRWLELLVVAIYVLEQTGSPSTVAIMTLLRLAPMLFCGPLIGALGDRYERGHLLLIGLTTMAATSFVLGWLALTEQITLWQIAIGAFLNGVFFAVDMVNRRVMSAEIAGLDRLAQAMALESVNNNATRLLGPLAGGILLETLGLHGAYLLGALIYLVAIALILRTHYRAAQSSAGPRKVLNELREGWLYARAQRLIVANLAVTLTAATWAFPYIAMVPVIGERVLGLSAAPIGLLASMEGVGALVGALLVGSFAKPHMYARIFLGSTFVFLLGVLGLGMSDSFPLSLLLNLVCGLGVGGYSVTQSAIMIGAARPEMRSRVMGLMTMSIGAGQLAGLLNVGFLADWLGASAAVRLIAVEGLIALVLIALIWPELRRADLASRRTDGGVL